MVNMMGSKDLIKNILIHDKNYSKEELEQFTLIELKKIYQSLIDADGM